MKFSRFAVIAVSILFFAGCPVSPPYREQGEWLSRLPPGSAMYLYIRNEPASRMFFELTARHVYRQNMEIQQLIDNTEALYGAIGDPDYYLLLLGHYPSFIVEGSLNSRADWKRENSKAWFQADSGITVGSPEEYSLLVTNGKYERFAANYLNPAANGVRVPETLLKEMKRGIAGFFFPAFTEHGMPEGIPFNKKKIPIREAWIAIQYGNGKYVLESAFNCVTEDNARLFAVTYRTFLLWLLKEVDVKNLSPVLKETRVLASGGTLLMEGLTLSAPELRAAAELLTGNAAQPQS
jgi:hypothetical protein